MTTRQTALRPCKRRSTGSHNISYSRRNRRIACGRFLEISNSLGRTLELDQLLEKIAEVLLNTFRQADRCFIIFRDDQEHLIPRVIKLRRPTPDASPRFSRTIVRKCLDSTQAFLSEDASTDSKFSLSQSITDFRILSVMCARSSPAIGRSASFNSTVRIARRSSRKMI